MQLHMKHATCLVCMDLHRSVSFPNGDDEIRYVAYVYSPWIVRHRFGPDTPGLEGSLVQRMNSVRDSIDTTSRPVGKNHVPIHIMTRDTCFENASTTPQHSNACMLAPSRPSPVPVAEHHHVVLVQRSQMRVHSVQKHVHGRACKPLKHRGPQLHAQLGQAWRSRAQRPTHADTSGSGSC